MTANPANHLLPFDKWTTGTRNRLFYNTSVTAQIIKIRSAIRELIERRKSEALLAIVFYLIAGSKVKKRNHKRNNPCYLIHLIMQYFCQLFFVSTGYCKIDP